MNKIETTSAELLQQATTKVVATSLGC